MSDVLGRVLLVAIVLYCFGWGLLSLLRLALRGLGGSTVPPEQITHAIERSLGRGRAMVPLALVGVALMVAARVARAVASRRSARARDGRELADEGSSRPPGEGQL